MTAVALAGSLVLAGCSSTSVDTVSPQDFLVKAAEPGVVVIDVRTPDEYAAGHVEGAFNLDVEAPTFSSVISELDKGATFVVYCHSGRRSGAATDAMAEAGFTSIYNLEGGMADLQSAGATITEGSTP